MTKRPSRLPPDGKTVPMTYLRIRGRLHDNMTYSPRPGHESPVPRREEGDPAYQLVLLDANDKSLTTVAPQVSPLGCGAHGTLENARVSGYIALHPDAVAYELRKGDIRIHRAEIAKAPPAAPQVDAKESKTGVTLRWKDAGNKGLTYSVVAEIDKGPRVTLARNLTETEHAITWKETALSGNGRILLIASDGVRASAHEAFRFSLPDAPPTVHILSPDGEAHMFGQPLSLIGTCLDGFGNQIEGAEIQWRVGKELVAKDSLMAVAYDPPEGRHQLTLVARIGGKEISTSRTLLVAPPDEAYRLWQEAVPVMDREAR